MAGTPSERHDDEPPGDHRAIATLELLGGRACLDFINTIDPRVGERRHDYLASYADLAQWSAHAQLLTAEQVDALLRAAARHPHDASALFARAIALRETLYRVFVAVAGEREPAAADLAAVHSAYVEMMTQAQLVAEEKGFAWQWPTGAQVLDQLLWPIIRSAVDLLTAPEVRRVRVCPGLDDCGWLFLDSSKSGRRRWCSMESCGSRAKMRRYYARTHAGRRQEEREH
jgi:predicted RNA-binding Zn ribbon-like protein